MATQKLVKFPDAAFQKHTHNQRFGMITQSKKTDEECIETPAVIRIVRRAIKNSETPLLRK